MTMQILGRHAIKATIDIARKFKDSNEAPVIITSYSGHGLLDLIGYDQYLSNKLGDSSI